MKIVIFDFDGVIANSFNLVYNTWIENGANITESDFRKRFEGNINDAYKPVDIDFHKKYAPNAKQIEIFDGIKEQIIELSKGYKLVIVSSTLRLFIDQVLQKYELASYFDLILSNEISKSKVEKFNMTFDEYQLTSNDCVLVTDTLGDLKEANKVNLSSIAVTWGFNTTQTLTRGNPAKLIHHPKEIAPIVNSIRN